MMDLFLFCWHFSQQGWWQYLLISAVQAATAICLIKITCAYPSLQKTYSEKPWFKNTENFGKAPLWVWIVFTISFFTPISGASFILVFSLSTIASVAFFINGFFNSKHLKQKMV